VLLKDAIKQWGNIAGGGISGSGPSIFMLSKNAPTAISVEAAMKYVYDKMGIAYHTHVTTINKEGVKVMPQP
jgi:homoserine kinase